MSWFVVGGVAIGATAGAIVGSKKGGDDVWKDALIGGAIGGTAGYAAAPAAAAEVAVPAIAGEAALPAGELVAGGTGIAGIGANATAPIAGTSATMLPGATTPIAAAAPQAAAGSTGIAGVGANAAAPIAGTSSATMPGTVSSAFAPGMQAPVQMVQTPAATEYAMFGGDTASTASNAATQTPPPAADSPLNKGFKSAMGWLSEPKNAMLTGVLGLGALSMFNQNNENEFNQPNVQTAGYPLSPNFRPSRYQPTRTYADGGIASIGPQTGMFPQSQYDKTQFATPSQMPLSREVVGADYDTLTNPYTGEPPRFAEGGDTDSKRERYYKNSQQYAAMIDPRMKADLPETPDWVRSRGVYHDEDPDTKYEDALTAAQTRMGKAAKGANVQLYAMQKPTPMGKLNLGPVAGQEEERKATGGITSLGGYAHGGNPRLLRGPGDGMSDDIPATIAEKQPARLADGEFVVPADVVSGLGNGSTEAGAKKLHEMMDGVRVARTGTKKQGKQIKAEKYIPGKAAGGIASYAEGGSTQSKFNPDWYLQQNPDVAAAGVDPLQHYLKWGMSEGRAPYEGYTPPPKVGYNPDYYNLPFYQNQLSGAQESLANAQKAFDTQNALKTFDPKYYLNQYRDVAAAGVDPWQHYQQFGIKEGRSPYEGGQAGAQLQDPAALAEAQKQLVAARSGLTDIQGNIKRLESSPVRYDPYTIANRPSAAEPQFYGNIYRGQSPDYAAPGYTLSGGNLGQWNNVAGEAARAAQPASMNQQITQAYLQNLGRAPDTSGFNYWMNESGSNVPAITQAIANSPEAQKIKPEEKKKARKGGIMAAKK